MGEGTEGTRDGNGFPPCPFSPPGQVLLHQTAYLLVDSSDSLPGAARDHRKNDNCLSSSPTRLNMISLMLSLVLSNNDTTTG